jgi:uncharacterized protein YdhG (YjbR/CyaY superfamily)
MKKYSSVDEYIADFPANVREILEHLRRVIKESAPGAEESISYGMPGFKLNGHSLVYFSAWKKHIGFYGASSAVETFKKELAPYKILKGTIQFPLDKPMPLDLIGKIVKYLIHNFDALTGNKLAIIVVGEDDNGETEAVVFTGIARWEEGHLFLDRENEETFQLPDDTVERIKRTPTKISKIVHGAEFLVTMSIGPIPKGENPNDYVKTGLKWPK